MKIKLLLVFWGNTRYQGQGYMRQALLLFVDALFTRWSFRELKAYVDVENSAARRLCERVNSELLEIEYQSVTNPVNGVLRDICRYQFEKKKVEDI
ncbi:MAG: GNAT family protein [Acinetobacter sp.]